MLCPYCKKLISVNAESCMHCGRRNPQKMTSVPLFQSILSGRVSFVHGIISVCLLLYVVSLLISVFARGGVNPMLEPDSRALQILGWTGLAPVLMKGHWWTLITAMYLHGSLAHIFFNSLFIWFLGPRVEEHFGSSRFFIIYTVAGIVGFLASTFLGIARTIGASGAIFGLFGAFVFYGKDRGGNYGAYVYWVTTLLAIVLFFMGLTSENVDNFAHAGGFLAGLVWLLSL